MATYTVPWKRDSYGPMETALRNMRDDDVDEEVINRVYPAVKAALMTEVAKAVQYERGRKQADHG